MADQCYVGGYHLSPTLASTKITTKDALNPASAQSFELKFGCQSSITGLFVQQLADGIMGMDYSKTSYWWQMHKAKKISQRAFSLCMGHARTIDTPVGVMSLGGTNPILHDISPMIYARMSTTSMGFYNVHIRAIYLQMKGDDRPVKVENFETMDKVIVDSGAFSFPLLTYLLQ